MAGDTGTFTGVPMTMSTDIFSLSFSGSDSPAARTAREQEETRLYSTPSMVTGDGWAATTIPSDWYESSTAYWYDTPDAIPSEDEEKCCERANGLCEWLEPPCPYLAEEDRKIHAWDNKTCFEIHPDDMAEIRERFDWYNLAKKNVLYANRKTTTTCAMGAMDSLGSVLLGKSDSNSNVSLATDKIKFSVQAMSGDEPGTSRSMNGNNVPGGEISARGATGAKSLEMANPYTYSDSSNQIKSDVKSISLAGENGTTLTVENATEPFEIILPGKGVHAIPDLFFIMTSSEDIQMNHHVINMTSNYTVLYTTIFPATDGDIVEVFIKKTHYPNSTYYDYKVRLPLSETEVPDGVEDPHRWRHTFHPPENVTTWNDTYVLGIRLVQSQVDYLDTANKNNFTYTISSFITGCLFWNDETDNWSTDGCQVGPLTSANSTQCLCNHMTSFGSDFAVPPNTIDFATVFTAEKFLEALPVFITVALVLLIYVALLVWARRSDKADLLKWGATPLEDNLPTDTYHYQITVNTGVRKNAGTKSKINFILSGDEGDTGVRRLTDGKRKEHPNGSIYNYILSVECSLGPLTYLRIWHDNSGHMKKRSWFLDQVCVADLQSGDRKFFLCNRWLAVEEDDGMVDRIIPVAGQEDLTSFKHLFSSSVRKKITNDHLWVSIFSRPTKSTFTRVQRISCCVCLLFLTMIANCMFFRDASEQEENVEALNIGPLQFTMQQLFISIVSTCIVFPPSLFIVTVFKKVKPKKNAIQHMNQNMSQKFKWRSITPGSSLWTNVEKSRFDKFKESMNNILTSHQRAKYESDDIPQEDHFAESKKKKKRFMFPYWMIYIAWIICILGIVTSAFFTVLYSMQWGRQKSLSWLQTFVLSFFQSVIVVQPVKVLLLAAFVSCIMKKPEEDDEEAVFDEQHAAPPPDSGYANVDDIQLQDIVARRKKAATEMPDVDVKALEAAREVRLKEIQMEAILKEFITYFIFVSVVFFLSYQTRDVASFDYAQNIKNTLVDNSPVNFQDGITNYKLFWKYINEVFLPNVYSGPHYNGQDLTWREKLQIDDRNTIRVGVPRMRLQRIKEDTCLIEKPMDTFVKHCRDQYSWLDDDTADYLTNWVPITDENQADRNIMDCYADAFDGNGTSLKDEKSPWTYSTSIELKSAPYAGQLTAYKGGGYTFSFKRNVEKTTRLLRELEINNWLDTTARAVFLEFTLYNANVNLFASCIFLVEYMATGSAISKADIKVFRLSSYIGGFGVIVLLMELIYVGFIIYFMVHEGNKIRKQRLKYFQDFWNLMEFATLAMSITAIAMYAMKKIFGTVAMNTLHESESGEYVNFVTISIWDELFGFILACVVFFTTLKFIKMLKFNRRMGMLGDTIKLATKDLKIFSITFFIYFAAFTMFAYAIFGTQLSSYGSFVSSAETLFAFALGDFDFYALQDTARILGPIFFFLYVGVIYIGLMGMFLTIIGESFSAVKASTDLQSNDYEIVEFITGKLKGIFGWS